MARVARIFVSPAGACKVRDGSFLTTLRSFYLSPGWTLADKFPLTAGTVSFTVPADVKQRDDYIVVLLGDSGNASPHFKINTNA